MRAAGRASAPASQPTTSPAALRERITKLLKQLDSDSFKERDGAQKQLQSLGVDALQPLREVLKGEKLSVEVTNRIKTAMWNIKGTTRPALINPPAPTPFPGSIAGIMIITPAESTSAENPED
ncbi:MAG: hypothetical protein ACE15C_13625 [Phycisphaerae bacterium]